MQKYHNFWRPVNLADMLEISVILKGYFHYRKIAVEQETELLKFSTYFFILI